MKRTNITKTNLKRLIDGAKKVTLYTKEIDGTLQARTDSELANLVNEIKTKYKKGVAVLILEDD